MSSSSSYYAADLFSVKGIVAVITGGGSGLGVVIANALDVNGAKAVYILGRRREPLQKVAKEAVNGTIKPIVADVTSKDDLAAAASKVREEHGFVNVVWANSGVIGPNIAGLFANGKKPSIQELQSTLWKSPTEEFTQPFHVNITGALYTAVAFLDLLDEGNKRNVVPMKSQVIVTSSIAAFSRMPAAGFAYSVSKAGVTHLVKMLATTLGPHKIRVNAVAPGMYPSEMTQDMEIFKNKNPRIEGAVPENVIPMQRTGTEEDMAGVALFLISRAGAYINGNILVTDGGRVSQMPATY